MGRPSIPLRDTIYKKHIKDKNGCWLWTGSIVKCGYGQVRHDWKVYRAHRASWIVHCGEIPNGLCVLHKCDVRRCVNPKHLFLGTNQDNMDDMYRKGRANKAFGDRSGLSKLTSDQVLDIRSSTVSRKELAKRYGVSVPCIFAILSRRNWKHLD